MVGRHGAAQFGRAQAPLRLKRPLLHSMVAACKRLATQNEPQREGGVERIRIANSV
jgi:hypothetical protein